MRGRGETEREEEKEVNTGNICFLLKLMIWGTWINGAHMLEKCEEEVHG